MAAEPANESSDFDSSSSSSAAEADATSTDDENDPSICSLCHATDRATTQIADCDELKSITDYIESSSNAVTKVKYACQTCLYKLYTIIDQNRLKAFKAEREQRLAAVAALIESTGAPSPSGVDPSASDSSLEATLPPPLPPTPPLPSANGLENDVAQLEIHDDVVGNESPSPPVSHDYGEIQVESNELLEVEQEPQDREMENINNKELEGVQVMNNEKQPDTNPNADVCSDPSSLSHLDVMYEQSESAFITESGGTLDQYKNPPMQCRYCPKVFVLIKPYKKHLRSHQSRLRSSRSASVNRVTPTNVVYACNDCSATFDSAVKLKAHCRIHWKRYYCSYCLKENLSLFDHNFHEAECKGVEMANEEFVETRRITRSISRTIRSEAKSNESSKSEKPARSLRSKKAKSSVEAGAVNDNADDDEDDEDCATSVAYTDFTAVNSYVNKWVAGTCRSEYNSSECMELENISEKEYDILMIEKLIIQSGLNVYSCVICDYSTNNLREMCLHEVVLHRFKTYYNCRKCRGVFTMKMYLDYHFYTQTYAEFRCNKCPMYFNYEYQLKYHLLQHQQHDEFPCHYCGNTFMSAQDLRIHCIDTTHDPKKRKKTISIDHTMTIVNETAPEPPPPKRTYTCTIKKLNLPKMPTKRPMNIKWPKGGKIFLGGLDFDMQPPYNCTRPD